MMGASSIKGQIYAMLSRNNTEKDTRHDELWLDFITKVEALSRNRKYEEIYLIVDADKDL